MYIYSPAVSYRNTSFEYRTLNNCIIIINIVLPKQYDHCTIPDSNVHSNSFIEIFITSLNYFEKIYRGNSWGNYSEARYIDMFFRCVFSIYFNVCSI